MARRAPRAKRARATHSIRWSVCLSQGTASLVVRDSAYGCCRTVDSESPDGRSHYFRTTTCPRFGRSLGTLRTLERGGRFESYFLARFRPVPRCCLASRPSPRRISPPSRSSPRTARRSVRSRTPPARRGRPRPQSSRSRAGHSRFFYSPSSWPPPSSRTNRVEPSSWAAAPGADAASTSSSPPCGMPFRRSSTPYTTWYVRDVSVARFHITRTINRLFQKNTTPVPFSSP